MQLDGLWSKTLNTGRARYLKEGGLVGDIMPRHYRMCDIYRMFGDAVHVTVLATVICKQCCLYRTL